jgi:putative tricarboxylic transport membrane protein
VAPGDQRRRRQRLEQTIATMVRSAEWREMLARYRWLDRYLAGDAFAQFAVTEEQRVRDILRALGTGADDAARSATEPYPLFVLAGLAIFGTTALITTLRARRRVQPASARRAPWRSVALIGVGVVSNLVLAEPAGFLLASALLFWFVARAFDERHPLRDAAFAVGISVGAYVLFTYALQLPLPAGVTAGWL